MLIPTCIDAKRWRMVLAGIHRAGWRDGASLGAWDFGRHLKPELRTPEARTAYAVGYEAGKQAYEEIERKTQAQYLPSTPKATP